MKVCVSRVKQRNHSCRAGWAGTLSKDRYKFCNGELRIKAFLTRFMLWRNKDLNLGEIRVTGSWSFFHFLNLQQVCSNMKTALVLFVLVGIVCAVKEKGKGRLRNWNQLTQQHMFLRREKILALFPVNSVNFDIKRTSLTFLNKVF